MWDRVIEQRLINLNLLSNSGTESVSVVVCSYTDKYPRRNISTCQDLFRHDPTSSRYLESPFYEESGGSSRRFWPLIVARLFNSSADTHNKDGRLLSKITYKTGLDWRILNLTKKLPPSVSVPPCKDGHLFIRALCGMDVMYSVTKIIELVEPHRHQTVSRDETFYYHYPTLLYWLPILCSTDRKVVQLVKRWLDLVDPQWMSWEACVFGSQIFFFLHIFCLSCLKWSTFFPFTGTSGTELKLVPLRLFWFMSSTKCRVKDISPEYQVIDRLIE